MYERHRDMAYEHGIYPAFQLGGAYYTTKENAAKEGKPAGTVTFSSHYHSNMRTFIGKYGTGILTIPPSWLITDYAEPSQELPSANSTITTAALKRTLECFNNLSRAHPAYGQYVVYLDEPIDAKRVAAVKAVKDIMNSIPDMRLKMMLSTDQRAYDILDSSGKRCADIWVCYGQTQIERHASKKWPGYLSLETLARNFLNDPMKPNAVLWTDSSLGDVRTDADLLVYRDFAWYGYTLGATGGFGWQLTMPFTASVGDAWTQAKSYVNPEAPSWIYNGYGFHIYPGNPERVGLSGVGGPIASMRLKMWRKACEDFEYFKLLESLADKSTVDAIVSRVVKGYRTCAAPEEYTAARNEIAELIMARQ